MTREWSGVKTSGRPGFLERKWKRTGWMFVYVLSRKEEMESRWEEIIRASV